MSVINQQDFTRQIVEMLNDKMTAEAEPIIQKACKDYEYLVRQKVAEFIQVYLEKSYSVERRENNLVITVHHLFKKDGQ